MPPRCEYSAEGLLPADLRYVALLGHPVGHSVSPAMHDAAFQHTGLHWRYLPFDVPPQRLLDAVRGLAALDFVGANVTIPHKENVLSVADEVDADARLLGAANTLLFREGRVYACNTDVDGFVEVFQAPDRALPQKARVVVLGAGGAARAVVAGCARLGVGAVTVLNRTLSRANALAISFQNAAAWTIEARVLSDEAFAESLSQAALVVQTTSLGMAPHFEDSPATWPPSIPPGLLVFDAVYNPPRTRFMREAAERGARVYGGLDMLVGQGAHAFERWTGKKAPRDVMRRAAETALHWG